MLREQDVVESNVGDKAFFGRKWRSSMSQLGFITGRLTRVTRRRPLPESGIDPRLWEMVNGISGLTGRPYEITPSGRRLIGAESPSQQQECFLRAVAAYRFPSVGFDSESDEEEDAETPFHPLRVVLRVLEQLERAGLRATISREELASIVLFEHNEDDVLETVNLIGDYRQSRQAAPNKKAFDKAYREAAVARHENIVQPDTLRDYADASMRHLLITGLFARSGDAIMVAPERQVVTSEMLSTAAPLLDTRSYLRELYTGAGLPTDSRPQAEDVIRSIASLLRTAGRDVVVPDTTAAPIEEVTQLRLRLEDEYKNTREEEFARRQAEEWQDITETMRKLANNRREFPDPPAYLEWALWRAFLAVNSLSNKPWDARRFNVDRDFLPMHTAPGNGADMIFEFEDFVLVVEVTFTASSRQEGAEGEPVRRHVATEVVQREASGKPVYGLFIANTIDSNTAETFRIGTWYKADDSRLALRIVPLTLSQFADTFEAAFVHRGRLDPARLMQLLKDCLVHKGEDGPRWKACIADEVRTCVSSLQPEYRA